MISPKLIPTIMIILCILSAIVQASHGLENWRMILYWSSAAVLNFAVTW
jgi:hypothetical protein